jgi:hypothetical protein
LQFLSHTPIHTSQKLRQHYFAADPKIAWGPVVFNRNHVFVFNAVYELPFGKGKAYMGGVSKAMDYLVGGWQVSNTSNWSSGLPWTPSFGECGPEQDVGICRPNKGSGSFDVGAVRSIPSPIRSILHTGCEHYYNHWAFRRPGVGNLGNIGRNSFHGPSGFYSDMSAVKKFQITEKLNAQSA